MLRVKGRYALKLELPFPVDTESEEAEFHPQTSQYKVCGLVF